MWIDNEDTRRFGRFSDSRNVDLLLALAIFAAVPGAIALIVVLLAVFGR